MVEEIITALSRTRWLFVIARNSSFTYKGRAVGVKEVGRELGVRYVLEGSVRKAASRVRITAQLVEAENGRHLWAERYDRDLADVFALQDDITVSVVAAIEPSLRRAGEFGGWPDRAHDRHRAGARQNRLAEPRLQYSPRCDAGSDGRGMRRSLPAAPHAAGGQTKASRLGDRLCSKSVLVPHRVVKHALNGS